MKRRICYCPNESWFDDTLLIANLCSDYVLNKFLSYVFSYIISFVRHAHTYLFENEISFPPCLANSMVDSDCQIGGGQSSRPWDNGGLGLPIFFQPFGPQFGLWIRGGPAPLGPSPRSATATVHTYPVKTVSDNACFQKHSPDRRFLKCRLIVWTDKNGGFRIRYHHVIHHTEHPL